MMEAIRCLDCEHCFRRHFRPPIASVRPVRLVLPLAVVAVVGCCADWESLSASSSCWSIQTRRKSWKFCDGRPNPRIRYWCYRCSEFWSVPLVPYLRLWKDKGTRELGIVVRFNRVLPNAQHDIFVGYESATAVFAPFPPVTRDLRVQAQVVAFLEAQLTLWSGGKIELRHSLQGFRL